MICDNMILSPFIEKISIRDYPLLDPSQRVSSHYGTPNANSTTIAFKSFLLGNYDKLT